MKILKKILFIGFSFCSSILIFSQEKKHFQGKLGKNKIHAEITFLGDNQAKGFLCYDNSTEKLPINIGTLSNRELNFITLQRKDENSDQYVEHCDFRLDYAQDFLYKGMANCGGMELETSLTLIPKKTENPVLETSSISTEEIPVGVFENNSVEKSEILKSYKYQDNLGTHYTFIAKKGPKRIDRLPHLIDDSEDAELYAQSFLQSNENQDLKKEWQIYDYINDCPLQISADFIENGFVVTDLNQNSQPEIWVVYKLGCSGGVDALDMKIIMYENGKKYAMRGKEKKIISYEQNSYSGGNYTIDNAFLEPENKSLLEFSKKLWNQFVLATNSQENE